MVHSLNIYFGKNVKQFEIIAPIKIKKLFVILLCIAGTDQKAVELEISAEHLESTNNN